MDKDALRRINFFSTLIDVSYVMEYFDNVWCSMC